MPVYRDFCGRSVIYTVQSPSERGETEPVSPLTLALALRKMLDEGDVGNQPPLAREVGLTRARITQLLNLLELPPAIVAELSAVGDRIQIAFYTERRLRPVTTLASEEEQLKAFHNLREEFLARPLHIAMRPTAPNSRNRGTEQSRGYTQSVLDNV